MAEAEKKSGWVKVVVALVALVLIGAGTWFVMTMDKSKSSKPKAPKISLIAAPPPPPPPPPKEEKKPEPPKEVKEIKMEQPTPKAEATPPSQDLKMEGAAGNGPSAFAAGRVSNEDISKVGKGDGTGGGKGGGGGLFDPFNNYANLVKGEMQRLLRKNSALKSQRYTVEVKVWFSHAGAVEKVEISTSTGNDDLDDLIRKGIASMPTFNQAPPQGMAQPIRLRIMNQNS
jgi:protein TonB